LKESKYVRLANTIYRVLRNSRIPLFLHRKSNHIFSVWQHIVLLTVRQYEDKSYRMFAEWLVEATILLLVGVFMENLLAPGLEQGQLALPLASSSILHKVLLRTWSSQLWHLNEPFPSLYENADFSIDTIKASIKDGEIKTNQILKNIKMS
jgi:hypothetical protein